MHSRADTSFPSGMYPDEEARGHARETILRWRGERRGPGPMGLADLARHAAALADAAASIGEADLARSGGAIRCAKGCGACCRQVVPLNAADLCLLAEAWEAMDWERRAEADERFRRAAGALAEAGLSDGPLLDRAGTYFSLGIPCPFLRGEACSMHVTRPLACRGHLVSSDPSHCGEFPSPSIQVMGMPFPVDEAMSDVLADLLGAKEMLPLIRLPDWLASEPGIRDRRWDGDFLLDRLASACLARLA